MFEVKCGYSFWTQNRFNRLVIPGSQQNVVSFNSKYLIKLIN